VLAQHDSASQQPSTHRLPAQAGAQVPYKGLCTPRVQPTTECKHPRTLTSPSKNVCNGFAGATYLLMCAQGVCQCSWTSACAYTGFVPVLPEQHKCVHRVCVCQCSCSSTSRIPSSHGFKQVRSTLLFSNPTYVHLCIHSLVRVPGCAPQCTSHIQRFDGSEAEG